MKSTLRLAIVLTQVALVGCGSEGPSQGSTSPIPVGFSDICEQPEVTCQSGERPPTLVGNYAGSGKTLVTSSRLCSAATPCGGSATAKS